MPDLAKGSVPALSQEILVQRPGGQSAGGKEQTQVQWAG